jgi:uncharacterized membrane protein YhiD involved in acid resistance
MAVGAGMLGTAIFATLLVLVALVALGILEERLGLHTQPMTFQLTSSVAPADLLISAHKIVEEARVPARRWQTHKADGAMIVDFEAEVTYPQERELITKFGTLNAKVEVRPSQV